MPLTTYAELKDSLTNQSSSWTKRGDILSLADDFIDLAESRMYSWGQTPLRVREMEATYTASLTIGNRELALPERYIELRRMQVNQTGAGPLKLDYVVPLAMVISGQSGRPRYFTVTDTFVFDFAPDQAYSITAEYYQSLEPLSDSNPTNAILTKFPGIYLYGCLMACAEWALQGERAAAYEQRFMQEIAAANRLDSKGRYGPAPVIARQGYAP